ncbi:MAG: CDP-alcohol phosphatidyltransferase family protein [Actinobacteria bacterium]|nr:CDP-alcohol phosphatidyltransferase family protein [Actinomycetota bacterium]
MDAEQGLGRVWTVPNGISFARLACIPVFGWLVLGAHQDVAGAVLLAVLGATDWVDGRIARQFNQVTTLGKLLDPIADRLLVATGAAVIIAAGAVPVWLGALTLAREALISLAALGLLALGAPRIDVVWIGKAGTFAVMVAYPSFLIGDGSAAWQLAMRDVGWVSVTVGLALGWIAVGAYIKPARSALASRGEAHLADLAGDSSSAVDADPSVRESLGHWSSEGWLRPDGSPARRAGRLDEDGGDVR